MKLSFFHAGLGLLFAASLLSSSCNDSNAQDGKNQGNLSESAPDNAKFSYALGVVIGENFKGQGLNENLDINEFSRGVSAAFSGETEITAQEAQMLVQTTMQAQQEAKGAKVLEAGEKYLEENAKNPSVKTTASGLQYEVLTEGDGPKPQATDKVTVHYHGTLMDGKVFDSSVDRGEPATFGLNQVIPGWTEGVQLMSLGAKYRFTIPYSLGYGERGAGANIPPYSVLIFEVELIKIGE